LSPDLLCTMDCDWTEAIKLKLRSTIIINVKGILDFTTNTSINLFVHLEIIALPTKNYDGSNQRKKLTDIETVARKDWIMAMDRVHDNADVVKIKTCLA